MIRRVIEVDEGLQVARPINSVFAHLARLEALPDWLPAIRSAERLDAGPIQPGSRARLVLRGPTGDVRATGEVTELVVPSLLAFRTIDAPAKVSARCDLTAAGPASTHLRVRARVELPGLLRFGEGMLRDRLRAELPAALAELRVRIEDAIPA